MSQAQQQFLLDKEAARIQAKREANDRRTERFLNARARTIGLDVQALDAQVAEKQRNQQNDRDSDKLERIRAKEIDKILEAAAEEENAMRKFQMQELKKDWESKVFTNTKRVAPMDYEPEKFGPSSFQVFDGEDTMSCEREAIKKEQFRRWTQEQVTEHAVQKKREKDEDLYAAEIIKQIDYVRVQTEEQEKELRRDLTREVKEENAKLAAAQRYRKDKERFVSSFNESGESLATSLPLSISTGALATDDGKVVRKDMFRGYTPAQRRKLLQENEYLREIKRQQAEADRQLEADWAQSQLLQLRVMEQANYEEEQLRKFQAQNTYETIHQQAALQQSRREQEKKERMGAMSAEFFNNFGKSCR